jgi:hypothetical protein
MKKYILVSFVLLASLFCFGDDYGSYRAIQDKIARYQNVIKNNAGTVEQRNYYRRQITELKRRLKDFDVIQIDVDQDMQAIDTVVPKLDLKEHERKMQILYEKSAKSEKAIEDWRAKEIKSILDEGRKRNEAVDREIQAARKAVEDAKEGFKKLIEENERKLNK